MGCYHPLPGWYSRTRTETGKRGIVFNPRDGIPCRPVSIPCGKCLGCRLEYSRQWAIRCMHESKCHETSSFVTLTYDDNHLPRSGSLRPEDYTLFMKRLRHKFPLVRYFQCGEYGERLQRPHHHAILFGVYFPDQRFLKSRKDTRLYTSNMLEQIWQQGQCTIGAVTFDSAQYVARYTMKHMQGSDHYQGRVPEYCTMSRRPGIGATWIDRYRNDVYPHDEVIVKGLATRPPRYYDNRLEKQAPTVHTRIKGARRADAARSEHQKYENGINPHQVLHDKEIIKQAAITQLKREYEE